MKVFEEANSQASISPPNASLLRVVRQVCAAVHREVVPRRVVTMCGKFADPNYKWIDLVYLFDVQDPTLFRTRLVSHESISQAAKGRLSPYGYEGNELAFVAEKADDTTYHWVLVDPDLTTAKVVTPLLVEGATIVSEKYIPGA